jgi:Ner family transcriptional regulator
MYIGLNGLKVFKKQKNGDWAKDYIIYLIKSDAETSLRALSIANGFSPNTFQSALHRPYLKAEVVISAALNVKAWDIWPSRYKKEYRIKRAKEMSIAEDFVLITSENHDSDQKTPKDGHKHD